MILKPFKAWKLMEAVFSPCRPNTSSSRTDPSQPCGNSNDYQTRKNEKERGSGYKSDLLVPFHYPVSMKTKEKKVRSDTGGIFHYFCDLTKTFRRFLLRVLLVRRPLGVVWCWWGCLATLWVAVGCVVVEAVFRWAFFWLLSCCRVFSFYGWLLG